MLLACWKGLFGRRGIGKVRQAAPLCVFGLWREHNACCFENQELSVVKLKCLFLKTLYEWTLQRVSFSVEGLLDLMDSLYIN